MNRRCVPTAPWSISCGGQKCPPLKGAVARNLTPVATAAQIVDLIWELPGTKDFRSNCAKVCVRYIGGDETLVDEIRVNRQVQQTLRETNPSHPARLFGEAVEAESNAESDAIKRKREELQLKRLEDEIQELEFTAKRRRVENYVGCYTSLAAHGIKLDDRNKLAIKDYVDTTLMPSHANVLQDTPAKELCPNLPHAT